MKGKPRANLIKMLFDASVGNGEFAHYVTLVL